MRERSPKEAPIKRNGEKVRPDEEHAKENEQSLNAVLKEYGKEWRASYSNRLKELDTPPEFLQKAFQIARSITYRDRQRSPDEILRLSHIEKTYVFKHPFTEKTPSGFRFLYENIDLKLEIFNQNGNIILSLYAKSRGNDGQYVGISVPSASKVSSETISIRWAEGMPENMISGVPLGLAIVRMEIAKMLFDQNNKESFGYITSLFDEVKTDLYKIKE